MKKLSQQLGSTIPFLTVANNKKKRTSQIGPGCFVGGIGGLLKTLFLF